MQSFPKVADTRLGFKRHYQASTNVRTSDCLHRPSSRMWAQSCHSYFLYEGGFSSLDAACIL